MAGSEGRNMSIDSAPSPTTAVRSTSILIWADYTNPSRSSHARLTRIRAGNPSRGRSDPHREDGMQTRRDWLKQAGGAAGGPPSTPRRLAAGAAHDGERAAAF